MEIDMHDEAGAHTSASDYESLVATARTLIRDRAFDAAKENLGRALADKEGRPEAYNLLGVLEYVHGERLDAQKLWRVALAHNPTYAPAQNNLTRSTHGPIFRGPLDLGD